MSRGIRGDKQSRKSRKVANAKTTMKDRTVIARTSPFGGDVNAYQIYQKSFWKTMPIGDLINYCLKLFKEAEFWRNAKV